MLKLRVKTLPFQPTLEHLQIVCGSKTSQCISLFFSNIMTLIVEASKNRRLKQTDFKTVAIINVHKDNQFFVSMAHLVPKFVFPKTYIDKQ